MARPSKYPDELMERAVRLVMQSGRPIAPVARDLGIHPEALRKRVRRAEVDAGKRNVLTTAEREELKVHYFWASFVSAAFLAVTSSIPPFM